MEKILVTGANGFIGRNALQHLLTKDFEIHAVTTKPHSMTDQIIWHQADFRKEQDIISLMHEVKPSNLLHFAWYAEHGRYLNSERNFDWVSSSIQILREFEKNKGNRVVMAGTCLEYDVNYGYCKEGVTPERQFSPYGVCKHVLQRILNSYSEKTGISSAWGRIFFLYGPYENSNRLVASVICSLLKNQNALCTHGNQIRDFLHVDDVGSAFVSLLESDVTGPVNISSGIPITVRNLANTIYNSIDNDAEITFGAIPVSGADYPVIFGDNQRLREEVKWKPRYDLESGINQTIDWWKNSLSN